MATIWPIEGVHKFFPGFFGVRGIGFSWVSLSNFLGLELFPRNLFLFRPRLTILGSPFLGAFSRGVSPSEVSLFPWGFPLEPIFPLLIPWGFKPIFTHPFGSGFPGPFWDLGSSPLLSGSGFNGFPFPFLVSLVFLKTLRVGFSLFKIFPRGVYPPFSPGILLPQFWGSGALWGFSPFSEYFPGIIPPVLESLI